MLKALRFINLFAAGIETGTELFVLRAVLPVIRRWSDAKSSEVHREILVHGAYSYILVVHLLARVTALLILILERGTGRLSRVFTAAGFLTGVGITILTLLRLFPINQAVTDTPRDRVPEDYPRLREQWDRGHALRTAMGLFTFACSIVDALASRTARRQ